MTETATKEVKEAAKEAVDGGLLRGLRSLDADIRASGNPGPEGSGLYLLLETCAAQFMGVARRGFPAEEKASEAHEPPQEPARTIHAPPPPSQRR